ncbi:MAG: hypothetical protein KAR57_01990 [Bacteroidales bacterium]|nr:hypothetical protein [Bacteroidales bacterium]
MAEKKHHNFQSPDLNKMQAVIVDFKTKIFIPIGADPEKAKIRFLEKINAKYVKP